MIKLTDTERAAILADARDNAEGAGVGDTLRLLADYDALERELDAALAELAALKGGQEAVAWSLRREVDPCGLVRYMTQAKYEKQTEGVKAWYEPYKCANCEAPPAQASAWAPKMEGLCGVSHQLGMVCVRFKNTEQAHAAVRELRAMLAAAPTPGDSDGKGGE